MSSSGSRSDEELDPDYELALRIALERSKVESGGCSGSAVSSLPRRRSSDAGTGPSRPVHSSDRRPVQSAPPLHRPLPPPAAAPPRGQRWVLLPAPLARTRTPESEACAARRERQWQRDRREAEQFVCHRCRIQTEPDEDARLLEWVYRRSLMTVETDARRLRLKNAKAFRIAIEQSERDAVQAAAEAARLAKLHQQQGREVRRLKGFEILSDTFDHDDDHGSSPDDSDDPLSAADAYSCAGDRKGKGPARKW